MTRLWRKCESGSGSPSTTRPGTTTKCPLRTPSATLRGSYGDDNPLYNDPAYAATSPWESSIAPPLYPLASGVARPVVHSDVEKAILKAGDPLAGIGQYMCGERWIFPKPIRAGDVLWHSETLHSAGASGQ